MERGRVHGVKIHVDSIAMAFLVLFFETLLPIRLRKYPMWDEDALN